MTWVRGRRGSHVLAETGRRGEAAAGAAAVAFHGDSLVILLREVVVPRKQREIDENEWW